MTLLQKIVFLALVFSCLIPRRLFSQTEISYASERNFLTTQGKSPAQYVLEKFNAFDIVFLGEDHAIKQNLEFVESLIPQLYAKGIYTLGMEFGASEMQPKLDSLVSAPAYNEDVAREMMYYYNVGWAYKEYMEIYRSAWKFNRSLPENMRKFRILNISYQYDWTKYQDQKTPENMSRIFWKGTPDDYRARLIKREIMDKHEKILLYVGTPHAFTRYKPASLSMNSDNFCQFDNGWLGNRLLQMYPGKVFSMMLHQPFYNKGNKTPHLVSPAGGAIEVILKSLGNPPLGFDLVNTRLGNLRDSSTYSTCYGRFTLDQLFDGYIFLKPFSQLEGCTIDPLYFKNKSWEAVKKQIPDPDWNGSFNSLDEYWVRIKKFVNLPQRYRDVIQ